MRLGRTSTPRCPTRGPVDDAGLHNCRSVLRLPGWTLGMTAADTRPLIAHVLHRFDVGGLENGVVNLLNGMPCERFRHAVIALTEITPFRDRVLRDDVTFVELRKSPGHGIKLLPRLLRLFRQLRPTIVHTRNLAALEASIPAWLAGIPVRMHGEHGRDIGDLDGSNRTYRMVRRIHRPFVTQYVALSQDLEGYLVDAVGVPPARIARICNGVDTDAFRPAGVKAAVAGTPFSDRGLFVFGTVGRLQRVKNQALLARAFVRLLELAPEERRRLRLVIVGEGPMRSEIAEILARADALTLAWLPGSRNDVAEILRSLDVFVLPSLAEGISNTILEAMASGVPVIATRVGGNAELVDDDQTGTLVASGDPQALAEAMLRYVRNPDLLREQGRASRIRAEQLHSLDAMVAQYVSLYDRLLCDVRASAGTARAGDAPHVTTGGD